MQTLIVVLQGLVMGIVETVPGVSGSTLALIMGIYEEFLELLHQISNIIKTTLKLFIAKSSLKDLSNSIKRIHIFFALKLGLGMAIGIIMFSHVLSYLITKLPMQTYAFFFGLILFSISIPYRRITKKNKATILLILLSTCFFIVLFGTPAGTTQTPSALLLLISGILGISGLILPGVSGSFILLILGTYEYIFTLIRKLTSYSINSTELTNFIIFFIGLLIGFIIFVKILRYLLSTYNDYVMAIITSIMIASLRILWPFMNVTLNTRVDRMKKLLPTQLPLSTSIELVIILLIGGGLITLLQSKKTPSRH